MKRLNALVRFCIVLGLSIGTLMSSAQVQITGRVMDGESGEALPFVTVLLVGTPTGTTTDFDGNFSISYHKPVDSIRFEYVGYVTAQKALKKLGVQNIEVSLYPDADVLSEAVVRPGVNPALRIIEAAQKKRKDYNIDKLEYYEYESYNKIQLAVDNISDRFKKRKLFAEMAPLFDTIGVLTPDSTVPVLPVFISETISDYYYRKLPRRTREVIKATRLNGVGVGEDSYISQILGSTFQQYNFNENNLYILDKDFVSPISALATAYYGYMLLDSMYIGKDWCYQIMVFPKNEQDLVFRGMIWITDSTYALKRLNLEITSAANLNYIEKLKIQQELREVEPGSWVPEKLRVLIDISEITSNTVGMVGLYYNSNRNIIVNRARELEFYEEKLHINEKANDYDDIYWDSSRHEKITTSDIKIYKLVDSLKNQPLIKAYVETVELLVEGFYPMGKIELGPYYYLLGYNGLEGYRMRAGFRTTEQWSKNYVVKLYGAYGFGDHRWKYITSWEHILSHRKWTKIGLFSKSDVELIGLTDRDYGTTALYDAFALLGTDRINRSTEYRIWAERELITGYTQRIAYTNRNIEFEPLGTFNFHYYTRPSLGDSSPVSSRFHLSTLTLEGRISHKELLIVRKHQRISMGNLKAPVVKFAYQKGFDGFGDGDFDYDKLDIHVWQFNSLANLGTFEYNIRFGKTWGTIPYPVLEVMRGNEGFFATKATYNLMNFYEFVADQYLALAYEHQFNGLIMNRIPVVRNWKWRLWLSGKAVWGSISEANYKLIPTTDDEGLSVTPIGQFEGYKPYAELSYGLENIFKLIRVDFIHRISYLDHANSRAFGVKANLVFRF